MMKQLNNKLHEKISKLCKEGDLLVEQKEFDKAIEKYNEALDLIPEPIRDWEASTWIYTAIGETYFFMKDYQKAKDYLTEAMHCPDAIGNPLIHLRLGQAQFELGNQDRAKDELTRAYMAEGKEIFADEDPKYFDFLKQHIKIVD